MHVLHVINSLGAGGAERSLAELLPELRARAVRSTVICLLERPTGLQSEVRSQGFDVRTLTSTSLGGRTRELGRILLEVRPDLVHTTIFDADLVGRLAAHRLRLPVLTSLVNTSYDPARLADPRIRRLKLEVVRRVEGWTARHLTTRFHAISHAVREASVGALGIAPELVTVVPRGRDPRRLPVTTPARRAAARRVLGLRPDDQIVVNVGRQEYQKGQVHLLRAAARLAADHPRLRALIAGRDGACSTELRRESAALGIEDRVVWLGYREDVPDVLAAADVFVFPSLFEGLGGAVLEALAAGLPLVLSDLPALREALGPRASAAFVPPGADAALAHAIERVLADDSLRVAWGHAGRQRFEECFTLPASADNMVALYRDTLARSTRASGGATLVPR